MKRDMRRMLALLCMALLTTWLVPTAMAAEGQGGGTQVPILQGITVSEVTQTTATVRFSFSNNIGADGSYNRQFFYLRDESGKDLDFTMKFWSDSTDPNRRVAQMNISGLQPAKTYTAGVRAGIRAKNGQVSTAGGSQTFTTRAATQTETPVPTATVAPTVTPTETARPTASAQPTPARTATPTVGNATATPADIAPWTGEQGAVAQQTQEPSVQPGSGGGTGGGKDLPLQLVGVVPADGAHDVPLDAAFVLEFNKNVVYLEVRENNRQAITLWQGDVQVEAEIQMVDDQLDFENRNFITVQPLAPLEEASEYTIKVADTMVAKSGSMLTAPLELHFYTVGYASFPAWGYAVVGLVIAGAFVATIVLIRRRRTTKGPGDAAHTDA